MCIHEDRIADLKGNPITRQIPGWWGNDLIVISLILWILFNFVSEVTDLTKD